MEVLRPEPVAQAAPPKQQVLVIFTQFGDAQPQAAAQVTIPSRSQALLFREDVFKQIESSLTSGPQWLTLEGATFSVSIRLADIVRIEITEVAADAGT